MAKASCWKYVVYTLLLGYFVSVVVSMAFVYSLIKEDEVYSLEVAKDTRELKTRALELENIFPGLFSSPYMHKADVEKEIRRQDEVTQRLFNNIKQIFRGDPEMLQQLEYSLGELAKAKHLGARKLEGNISYELATTYYRNAILPHVRLVTLSLDDLTENFENYSNSIQERIQGWMHLIIFASVVAGLVIVFVTMFYDRRMEEDRQQLAYRENMFQQLASSIDEVFIIAGSASMFDYVSSNTPRLLHLTASDIKKNPEKLYAILGEAGGSWLRAVLNGEDIEPTAENDIEISGMGRFFKLRVYAVCETSTRQELYIVVISDQTVIMRHQQTLNDALENANAASAAKSSFLSHMSHEIRTPMNAIIGMTTIALSRLDDKKRVQDCLAKVSESSQHLLGLINDILDMSKIEAGKLSISNEKFNLHDLVENLNHIGRPQAQARKLNFEILVENIDEEHLIGDSMRLNQVFLNILSNAFKFTPEGGEVVLKMEQLEKTSSQTRIRFTISDTGIGMSKEFLEKIYRPFEQATASTASKYGGTGLGMPITFNLVTMMGGSINVTSTEGKGTTFFVELPFGLAAGENEPTYTLDPIRVLVVDDDEGTCEHAAMLLARMGVDVEWTLSGADAIEKARAAKDSGNEYKICLIDWKMPGMNGAETANGIRQISGNEAQVIIISAYDWTAIEDEAVEAGVVEFVAKPFFASTLYNAILAASRRLDCGESEQQLDMKPKHDFSGSRVLLVEDNEFNREIGQEFLEMVNIEVENAENGREAVDKVTASPSGYYDLVLMDVQMPVMGGYEATSAIRASSHPEAKTLPIVAMTANAFNEDVAQAVASGMNGHLAKPIDIEQLYNMLEKYLGAPPAGSEQGRETEDA